MILPSKPYFWIPRWCGGFLNLLVVGSNERITWFVQPDEPMTPTATLGSHLWQMILSNHTQWIDIYPNHKKVDTSCCKSRWYTRTNGRENSQSSRGQLWHNPKDKSIWLLYFSESNSWLGFQRGVGVLFIQGTSLLVGLNGLVLAQFDSNRVLDQCSLK